MTIALTEDKPRRRDRLVIMAEIIEVAKKGKSKTHIMLEANLSFSQLSQYLSVLSQSSLLEKLSYDGGEFYKATPKGTDFVEKQRQIINLLDAGTHTYRTSVKTSLFDYNPLPRTNYSYIKLAQE
jgi:predicted transcriptional regulator